MRASARSTIRRRRARPASSGSFAAADVPVNLNTLLSLIQFGKDDEPSLATDVVRYKGEPILAIVATSERAALEAMALVRVSYDPLPAVFDVEEAMKPGAPSRSMPPIRKTPSNTTASTIIRSCASATWTRASRRPKSCSRSAIRCRRSSTRRPRPTARSRCRTPTAASSSTPRPRRCSSRSTPRPRSTPCNRTNCISSAAPSAAASAARSTP